MYESTLVLGTSVVWWLNDTQFHTGRPFSFSTDSI